MPEPSTAPNLFGRCGTLEELVDHWYAITSPENVYSDGETPGGYSAAYWKRLRSDYQAQHQVITTTPSVTVQ